MELRADRTRGRRGAAYLRTLEPFLQEASALLGLVDFIESHVREHEQAHRYVGSTRSLFRLVRDQAAKTRSDVLQLTDHAKRKPSQIANLYRPALVIKNGYWSTLHSFVKPAADAHSLTTPHPLLSFAVTQVQPIADVRIVVLLTSELMYFQRAIRDFPAPTPQLFPPEIGFIEIPYSLGTSLFANLNVFHEIGHFLYELLSARGQNGFDRLATAMADALNSKPALRSLERSRKARLTDILESWTSEVFCDLFAIRLIGPAFTFAFIDLLWLTDLMREGNEAQFNSLHPSPACRMQEQLAQLRLDGWWSQIESLDTEHVKLIARMARTTGRDVNLDESEPVKRSLLAAFDSILDTIREVGREATAHIKEGTLAKDYGRYRRAVENCLRKGIVPSTVIGSNLKPGPVTLINVGYIFQLTRLPELMAGLSGPDSKSPGDRVYWQRKVEAWTMKALEDFEILSNAAETARSQK